ncbi:hypothetical protein GVN24_24020 [Rhizobium sp. CRIBSB]|nr:hypothetical protein [Rhizobium sp. CRIBSB]
MELSPVRSLKRVVLCAGVVVLTAVPALAVAARPSQPFAVAAVFPPWWTATQARSAVDPLDQASSQGRFANVVIVYGAPGLQQRLRNAGAWLLLDPGLVGCTQRSGGRT